MQYRERKQHINPYNISFLTVIEHYLLYIRFRIRLRLLYLFYNSLGAHFILKLLGLIIIYINPKTLL